MRKNRIADLRSKEIINIRDGTRFGLASDLEFSLEDGRISALIVPGPYRFWGVWGKSEDYVIPWDSVQRIGEDLILVDFTQPDRLLPQESKKKAKFLPLNSNFFLALKHNLWYYISALRTPFELLSRCVHYVT